MRTHNLRRSITSVIALGAVALSVAACGGDDEPKTDPTTSAPPSSSPTTSPTPDSEAWKSAFTPEQLKAYDAALQRFESYESRSEPIWAKGKATPAAENLFRDYWIAWQPIYERLKTYEAGGWELEGTPEVLSSEAKSIELSNKDTALPRVVIDQCINPATMTLRVNGEADPTAKPHEPYVRTITLDQTPADKQFKITSVGDITNQKKVTPCGP